MIDLSDYSISPWDYEGRNRGDDFLKIAERMVECSDIIFCTPVYWYSMSSQMKTFFDRMSDLITREKALGRGLAGRRIWLISVGSDTELPDGFEVPFRKTSEYFDMLYCGCVYASSEGGRLRDDAIADARAFGNKIVEQTIASNR